jgi:cytochrome P450
MLWRPNIAETGFPHVFTEDCEYEGYHFEKGTIVTRNSWHLSLNPEEYEDPLAFKPERYLNEHLWDTLEGQVTHGFQAAMISFHNIGVLQDEQMHGGTTK